jgi:hypothetical protein
MSSGAHVFFAGVGTTFVILAIGFGGGLMLAKTAVHDIPAQTRASSEKASPVRVILPASAEAAHPPQPGSAVPSEPEPQVQPVREVQALAPEKQVEKPDTKKAEREERERHRRYAERKARRVATARARQQLEQPRERTEPGIVAFGGEQSRSVGFFGN